MKALMLVLLAVIAGYIAYTITPGDWPDGKYVVDVRYTDQGGTLTREITYFIGPNSTDVSDRTSIKEGVFLEVEVTKLAKLEPGSSFYIKVRINESDRLVTPHLSSVHVTIKLPDGRSYTYYPTSIDKEGKWVVFKIQPFVKTKEVAFVFGSSIVLFSGATIIHYVVTGLYSTLALTILGIISSKEPFKYYMSNIVLIFIAGSALELLIRENGLDERIARLLSRLARSPATLILSSTLIVSFLSMWMSNTAATYVILPLVFAILNRIDGGNLRFSSILLVSIAMAASVGGTATLIGTPPNVIAAGFLNDIIYGREFIDFSRWLMIGLPAWAIGYSIGVVLALAYMYFVARDELDRIKKKLSCLCDVNARGKPWTRRELLALANIVFLVTLWLTTRIHGLSVGLASAVGLLVFFLTGSLDPRRHWKNLAWDLMVLFGAGLTLGKALMATGWANYLLLQLSGIQYLGYIAWFAIAFTAYLIGVFISSHTSASAFIAPLTIPLGTLLASSLELPLSAGASLATVVAVVSLNNAIALPISTPPSAIVFSTGRVRMRDLVIYGFLYGIIANLAIVTLLIPYWTNILTPQ